MFANFCKPIHDIINYSTFICHFESRKWGKEVKILQKFECLKNNKSFLDETENIIHSFWRAIIWWKIKKLRTQALKTQKCFHIEKFHLVIKKGVWIILTYYPLHQDICFMVAEYFTTMCGKFLCSRIFHRSLNLKFIEKIIVTFIM